VLGLQLGARSLRSAIAPRPTGSDAFVIARTRDLELALDLYRRERGAYPNSIARLEEDDWVALDQVRVPGYHLRYEASRDASSYRLRFEPIR
jgi:hypothetical protein